MVAALLPHLPGVGAVWSPARRQRQDPLLQIVPSRAASDAGEPILGRLPPALLDDIIARSGRF